MRARLEPRTDLNEDAPTCPRCGKRISADMSVCPACGNALIARRPRIRCAHCNNRIPADAATCPRCGADPRPGRASRVGRVGALIVVALLLLVCVLWIGYRAVTTNVLARMLPTPVPTRAATIIQVIYVVATPIPPTPTLTPTVTLTPTPHFSLTPTPRAAAPRGVRATAPAAPAATAPPAPTSYPAPQLLAPANLTVYTGADSIIILEWQPVAASGLRENEWYMISLAYTAREGKPGARTGWSKETRWTVPNSWWNDAAKGTRMFYWSVSVMRIEGIDPISATHRAQASPSSVTRIFFWH